MHKVITIHFVYQFLSIFLVAFGEETKKVISFDQEIKPIFRANCNGCHQPAKQKGDYLMTEFSSLLQGGETGKPAVVPGKPDESYLFHQIKLDSAGNAEMPKGKNIKPLHAFEITKIEQWIREGAIDDSPVGADVLYSMFSDVFIAQFQFVLDVIIGIS